MHILVIEDNQKLNLSLRQNLEAEGYRVDSAYDGQEGQDMAELLSYDLIILDVLLPRKDGLEVCRELRRRRVQTPILLLTARDSIDDRVQGLDSGADDYLVKPFAMRELLARLRALQRRRHPQGRLTFADLVVDPALHQVMRAETVIELTPKEFALLEYLLLHPDQVVTREMIESRIWNDELEGSSNVVDVYIRRLRRKIDDPFPVKLLETVRGIGYRLRSPQRRPAREFV
uniref:DNA-binding response regulator n=1 Tax=Thermosporothrix sp. COM3 TaxID=2490863 RepID=A0A455SK35_9CHLR|nr:DNA-binding response regulator [Thermosporothrix sp. COM3]